MSQSVDTTYISLKQVRKAYKIGSETLSIFDGMNLDIQRGEFLAIMGPSGSGKSTLLNLLAGIEQPDGGELTIDRRRIDLLGEAARASWRAHHLGIVFQFYNLLPMLTVAENVELPLLLKPLSRSERRSRVTTALDLVGLAGRERQYPNSMSGGQQQRIGIARAIVADPGLLLCDEPTGDLDRRSADEVLKMLSFLNQNLGKTIIMVTHDPQAAECAGRTLRLDKGYLLQDRRVV